MSRSKGGRVDWRLRAPDGTSMKARGSSLHTAQGGSTAWFRPSQILAQPAMFTCPPPTILPAHPHRARHTCIRLPR